MEYQEKAIVSLCAVIGMDPYSPNLMRLADFDGEKLIPPQIDEMSSKTFENREVLFGRNGPEVVGTLSLWRWRAIPNQADNSKDHILSDYLNTYAPIKAFELRNAKTKEEMISLLKRGVNYKTFGNNVLFLCQQMRGNYIAVFCLAKDLEDAPEGVALCKNVYSLPFFTITKEDILEDPNYSRMSGRIFYRYFDIPENVEYVQVYPPVEAVKELVQARTTWSQFKAFTDKAVNKDLRVFKEFLNSISGETIYDELARIMHCDEIMAQKEISAFITQAETYLDESDVDTEILAALVEHHKGLQKRCEDIAQVNWERKNQQRLEAAEKQLSERKEQARLESEKYADVKQKVTQANKKLEEVQEKTRESQQLAERSTELIKEKIALFQKDKAVLLAETALYFSDAHKTSELTQSITNYQKGKLLKENALEPVETWEDSLELIENNFTQCGITSAKATWLARVLFASYCAKSPVLFLGPFGEILASAFSTAICGRTPGVIDCSAKKGVVSLQQALQEDDSVIVIKNAFESECLTQLLPLIELTDKWVVFVHPFVEDLALEPKGLYNYMLPILTETFVEERPEVDFYGAEIEGSLELCETSYSNRIHRKLLKRMKLSPFAMKNMQTVLSTARELAEDKSQDMEYVCLLLPLASVTGEGAVLCENIEGNATLTKDTKEYILDYFNDEEI